VKSSRHGEHLVKLTRLRAFNCYLVREADGLTLVDTGLARSGPRILAAASKLGGSIVRIALTHAHVDHVGSLDALRAELPDVDVAVPAREARFMAGDKDLDPEERQGKLRGGFPKVRTRPTLELSPGGQVGSLEVVASPGHTPGHVSFLDTRDRTLIAGDAFQTSGGIAVSGVLRPLFPLPALATWHKPTAARSAAALVDLNPTRLAVGHGPVLEDPRAEMERAVAAAL
jgi:glyoxylase-like metal-dependent hydrolase (beta-lactamase superfamily II)